MCNFKILFPSWYQSSKVVREGSQVETLPSSNKDERYGSPNVTLPAQTIAWGLVSAKGSVQMFESVCEK